MCATRLPGHGRATGEATWKGYRWGHSTAPPDQTATAMGSHCKEAAAADMLHLPAALGCSRARWMQQPGVCVCVDEGLNAGIHM